VRKGVIIEVESDIDTFPAADGLEKLGFESMFGQGQKLAFLCPFGKDAQHAPAPVFSRVTGAETRARGEPSGLPWTVDVFGRQLVCEVPRHPAFRIDGDLVCVSLQLGEVIEGVRGG